MIKSTSVPLDPRLQNLGMLTRGGEVFEVLTSDNEVVASLCSPDNLLNLALGSFLELATADRKVPQCPQEDAPEGSSPAVQQLTADKVAMGEHINVLTDMLNRSLSILAQFGAFVETDIIGATSEESEVQDDEDVTAKLYAINGFLVDLYQDILALNAFATSAIGETSDESPDSEENTPVDEGASYLAL